MKTTIDLPDELLRRVKGLARREGVTMRELMVEGLSAEVERRSRPLPRADFVFRTAGGEGLVPDVDPTTLTVRAYDLPPMIAVDTNILVYAHRVDSPAHPPALETLRELAGGRGRWAVPWPCLHEFLAIVTHPRIFVPPTTSDQAVGAVEDLLGLRGAVALGESERHLEILRELMLPAGVVGPKIHDARVAAICLGHEVDELWTADRDFSYFPQLETRNPLVR